MQFNRLIVLFRTTPAPTPTPPTESITFTKEAGPVPFDTALKDYESIILEASNKYGVDPAIIGAVIMRESGGNFTARSKAGAGGLMQLMPGTAQDLGVTDVDDPFQNIMGGTKYLSQQLAKYDGDLTKALAAYNAGPGNVDKYNGVPPFEETEKYVNEITSALEKKVWQNNLPKRMKR